MKNPVILHLYKNRYLQLSWHVCWKLHVKFLAAQNMSYLYVPKSFGWCYNRLATRTLQQSFWVDMPARIIKFCTATAPTQQTHNVPTTSIQRCNDVPATLCVCWEIPFSRLNWNISSSPTWFFFLIAWSGFLLFFTKSPGPVLQGIISITSSIVVKMFTVYMK